MTNNMSKRVMKLCLMAAFLTMTSTHIAAQNTYEPAVYPMQQTSVGYASLSETEEGGATRYTFSNNLFQASFLRQGNSILFDGCEAMNLQPGTEIFTVKLGNGSTVVNASEMTLKEVTTGDLTGKADAVKGAHHFDGKYLQATYAYTYSGAEITFVWRAELRDGSHYLRTDLTMTSTKNVKINAIVPMQYNVDAEAAGSTPSVSGNTRGSLLVSDKIFAGLETPTGYNTAGSESDLDRPWTDYNSWNGAASFSWVPTELPAGMTDSHYNTTNIVGARGYLKLQGGSQTITFTYTGGTHKLNIAGVDVVNPTTGEVVASDYHNGRTGGSHAANVYTLNVPQDGIYMVRYFISLLAWSEGYVGETITSQGNITYSKKVKTVTVIHDLPSQSAPSYKSLSGKAMENGVSGSIEFNDGSTYTLTYGAVNATNWTDMVDSEVPMRVIELGYTANTIFKKELPIFIAEAAGKLSLTFKYVSGNHRLDIVGVDLIDSNGDVARDDYHFGYAGSQLVDNVYTFNDLPAGNYTVRLLTSNRDNTQTNGKVEFLYAIEEVLHLPAASIVPIQGLWSRDANLLAYDATNVGKDMVWNISTVVGLVNPSHIRRSVLAYSERERAVPWRPFPLYNSWYELNINHNNFQDPRQNMKVEDCEAIVAVWKQKLYDQYGVGIKSFVWDDGWDVYGTWEHHASFPNGFKECGQTAASMQSGTGAWLGPVGGYGTSGTYRRNYWNGKGGMQLSNPAYYDVFKNACVRLVETEPARDDYEFNFFKFDGISAQFSAVGPDEGSVGNENAEGIITCERYVRENVKEDIFFNTTVGTWASPFWYHFSDAIWRQEKDYGEIGVGSSREKWITYRDRLVYQNFVQNAPYCPINTLMTHGFIFHNGDGVSSNLDYAGALRELRCAFACGSGMVELYADHALMTTTNGGKLWGDLADCIKWQEANKDVLPDIHWVGGNPWTGAKAEIYGWAAWNGQKAVLTLRNGHSAKQAYKTTLRKALDVPASVTGKVVLSPAFADQKGALKTLCGVAEGEAIDLDLELTFTLPANSVYIFNGVCDGGESSISTTPQTSSLRSGRTEYYDLSGRRHVALTHGVNIVGGKKVMVK